MSTNHTTNYDLCQWEATDQVLHTDFNADNAKIDAALAAKAELSNHEALAQTVSGLSATVEEHTAAIAAAGLIFFHLAAGQIKTTASCDVHAAAGVGTIAGNFTAVHIEDAGIQDIHTAAGFYAIC